MKAIDETLDVQRELLRERELVQVGFCPVCGGQVEKRLDERQVGCRNPQFMNCKWYLVKCLSEGCNYHSDWLL